MAVQLVHQYLGGMLTPGGAMTVDRLRQMPILESLGDEELARLAGAGRERRLAEGEYLFREGDRACAFHLVLDGQLETTRDVAGEQVLMISHGPGGFLGRDGPAHGHPLPREHLRRRRDGPLRAGRRGAPPARLHAPPAAPRVPAGDRVGERRDQGGRARPREAARGGQARGRARARAEQPRRRRRPGGRDAARVRAAATGRLRRDRRRPAPPRSSSPRSSRSARRPPSRRCAGERLDPLAASDREQELVGDAGAARRLRPLRDRLRAHRRRGSGPTGSIASRRESATTTSPPACASWGPAPARASCWPSWRRRRRASPTSSAPCRSYSYLDQAPRQTVDIHEGLESTLSLLGHKLRGEADRDRPRPRPRAAGRRGVGLGAQPGLDEPDRQRDRRGRPPAAGSPCGPARQGERVCVEIGDDGPGIPADLQARIFDAFFTTKPVDQGTGLGLDIAQRIVVRHHGELRLESEPGDTRFQVLLPIV